MFVLNKISESDILFNFIMTLMTITLFLSHNVTK